MRFVEWLMGGDLMKPEPTQPSQILRRTTIGSALGLTLFVPLFSLTGIAHGIRSILDWEEGLLAWGVAIFFLFTLPFVHRRFREATLGYALIVLAALPLFFGFIDFGFKSIESQMDTSSTSIIVFSFLTMFLTLPTSVAEERRKFIYDIEHGRFRRSLDLNTGAWEPGKNVKPSARDSSRKKPSILVRLLIAGGPAIGMGLSDVVGQANAILIMGILSFGFGTFALRGHLSRFLAYALEFRRIEKEIGKPIFIAEFLEIEK